MRNETRFRAVEREYPQRYAELSALAHRTRDLGHLGPAAYYRAVISYLQGRPVELAAAYDQIEKLRGMR